MFVFIELDILWLDMVFWMSVERTSNGKSNRWVVAPFGLHSGVTPPTSKEPLVGDPVFGRVEAAGATGFDAGLNRLRKDVLRMN